MAGSKLAGLLLLSLSAVFLVLSGKLARLSVSASGLNGKESERFQYIFRKCIFLAAGIFLLYLASRSFFPK